MNQPIVLTLLAGALLLSACATPRRAENLGNAPSLQATEQRGRDVFMKHCNACHVGGSGALAPAINDKPLPVFLMKFQVRHGLGVMPGFSKEQISDTELEDLMAYLKALRRGAPAKDAARAGS